MYTCQIQNIKTWGKLHLQLQKLYEFLKCSPNAAKCSCFWSSPHYWPDSQLSLLTCIASTINSCLFPSILLLPWAVDCELRNPNHKLIKNYVLNCSSFFSEIFKAILQGWSFVAAASVLRGFVSYPVSGLCSNELELPRTCTLDGWHINCLRNFEMCFI